MKANMSPNLSDTEHGRKESASEKAERKIQVLVEKNSPGLCLPVKRVLGGEDLASSPILPYAL